MANALLLDAGSIVSASGSGKRRNELKSEEYDLNPNKMMITYYTNRFADVTNKAAYRLDNFNKVQPWYLQRKTIPSPDDDYD